MTRSLPEIEDNLAAALDAVTGHLIELDARWPALVAEHAASGQAVPRAEAHVRLGDRFASHPLFRAYEALSSALTAVRERDATPSEAAEVPVEDMQPTDDSHVIPADDAAVEASAAVPVLLDLEPEPVWERLGQGQAENEAAVALGAQEPPQALDTSSEEASVVIVGRPSPRERGRAAGLPPAGTSLRDRLSSVLAGNAEPAPYPAAPEPADRLAAGAPAAGQRPKEVRSSRLPSAPSRRASGLWREEASVVIVRSAPAESESDEVTRPSNVPGDS